MRKAGRKKREAADTEKKPSKKAKEAGKIICVGSDDSTEPDITPTGPGVSSM